MDAVDKPLLLRGKGFDHYSFSIIRRELLRAGNHEYLLKKICASQECRSKKSIRDEQIIHALAKNARWHCGVSLDSDYEIFNFEGDVDASVLDAVFTSYILNTSARYEEALSILSAIDLSTRSNVVEWYLGSNLRHVISTWKLWNCSEITDKEACAEDLRYVSTIKQQEQLSRDAKSNALLLLAAGVYKMGEGDYEGAVDLLLSGKERDQGWWGNRIHSALGLCFLKLGEMERSRYFTRLALEDRAKKFGPIGWQLRTVEALVLDNKRGQAFEINSMVKKHALKYKEVGYALWADVFNLVYFKSGFNVNVDLRLIESSLRKHCMRRALNFLRSQVG